MSGENNNTALATRNGNGGDMIVGGGEAVHDSGARQIMSLAQVRANCMPQNYKECEALASAFAKSRMFKVQSVEQAMVVLLTGMDMGVTPSVAFRGIHVIDGKPSPSADLMVAACKAQRDVCKYFICTETTAKIATFETMRVGDPVARRLSYTIEEAQQAGLTSKDNWRKYTAQMLRARASSGLARLAYPELMLGMYTPEELRSGEALDIEIADDVRPDGPGGTVEAEIVSAPVNPPASVDVQRDEANALIKKHSARVFGPASEGGRERYINWLGAHGHEGTKGVPSAELLALARDLAAEPDYVAPAPTPAPPADPEPVVEAQLVDAPDDDEADPFAGADMPPADDPSPVIEGAGQTAFGAAVAARAGLTYCRKPGCKNKVEAGADRIGKRHGLAPGLCMACVNAATADTAVAA